MPDTTICRPDKTCWRLESADRVAFLIDGQAYFETLAAALERAKKTVFIIGWDIDSRTALRRADGTADEPLGNFLDRLAANREDLHIYLLEWDFAVLYAFEREFLPTLSLGWKTHPRVHFELDASHPIAASHHQKIVVIDDRLAFVGGFDLACNRWDSQDHRPGDPRRRDNGKAYPPFHDLQMAVDGRAAAALGDLVRRRWRLGTGETLPATADTRGDPWPPALAADLCNATVAILRTEPQYEKRPAVEEIRHFYLAAIAAARRFIYIENQYLTAHEVGNALAQSLSRAEGPEVVIVLPRSCSGWLEQGTMGALRAHLVRQLREADAHRRLHLYYPHHTGLEGEEINVHSKLLIIDDQILRIGSSNLNNRSMGFDSECDLALEAAGREEVSLAIRTLLARLLGEHLGVSPETVREHLAENSLGGAIEALRGNDRTLQELPAEEPDSLGQLLSQSQLIDPERPISQERMRELLNLDVAPTPATNWKLKAIGFAVLLVGALGLAAAWRFTALGNSLDMDHLLAATEAIRSSPMTVPLVLVAFLVGSLTMVPVTLLILATALSFGPVHGFLLALGGSLLGGLSGFLAGRLLGRQTLRRLGGRQINRLSHRLARRGWLTMALVRVVPIAPFTIVNLMAGATQISSRDFLLGTLAGMGPGILGIMLFEGGVEHALRHPGAGSLGLAGGAIVFGVLLFWGGRRWLAGKEGEND